MKSDNYEWAPSNGEEKAYYDRLFDVLDRGKAGAIDGKVVVKFLSLSGLPVAQLQNVWATAKRSGGKLLQRNEFYVAMRVVALAQGGEATLTRKRVRETATDVVLMAKLKGDPKPPLETSKGKTPPPSPTSTRDDTNDSTIGSCKEAKKEIRPSEADAAEVSLSAWTDQKVSAASDAGVVAIKRRVSAGQNVANDGTLSAAALPSNFDASKNDLTGGESSAEAVSNNSDNGDSEQQGTRENGSDDGIATGKDRGGSRDKPNSRSNGGDVGSRSGEGCGSKYGSVSDASAVDGNGSEHETSKSGLARIPEDGIDGGRDRQIVSSAAKGVVKHSEYGFDSGSETESSLTAPSHEAGKEHDDDPYGMTNEARARYQGVFDSIVTNENGFMSRAEAVRIFAESGLDNDHLGSIWRMADLSEDGHLSRDKFAIAFHLVGCLVNKKIDLPEELQKSLWPEGHGPPCVLERRKEQEGVKGEKQIAKAEPARQKIEEETKNASRSANRTDVALPADSQRGDDGEDDDTNIRKTRQGKGKNNSEETMNARKESEARRKEEVARAANALQKREKLARSRKAPTASRKSTRTRMTVIPPIGVTTASGGDGRKGKIAPAIDAVSGGATIDGSIDTDAKKGKSDGKTRGENNGDNNGDDDNSVSGFDTLKSHKKKKDNRMKNKEQRSPSSTGRTLPQSRASLRVFSGEVATLAGPLSPAERRARKIRARAARLGEAARKKEAAARDVRLAELDQKIRAKAFGGMDPMKTTNGTGNLLLSAKVGVVPPDGDSSFARLNAPLPNLTLHPGRPPSLPGHEFSVASPSGIRRASSLTTSLELRLGPKRTPDNMKPEAKTIDDGVEGSSGGVGWGLHAGGTAEVLTPMVTCPVCATCLPGVLLERHTLSTCRLVPCPLCARLILPAAQEKHIEEACPKLTKACIRCGESVAVSDFARHERDGQQGGCPRKVTQCRVCGAYCLADELPGHERREAQLKLTTKTPKQTALLKSLPPPTSTQVNECPDREIRCGACGDNFPARELCQHKSCGCSKNTWTCACGKVGPMRLVEKSGHLKNCEAFLDAWEASIEKVLAQMPKIEVVRRIGKVMVLTRLENPGLALMALSECKGNASLAARKVSDDRAYLDELSQASGMVNVNVFLNSLRKPGKRRLGTLWREGYLDGVDPTIHHLSARG